MKRLFARLCCQLLTVALVIPGLSASADTISQQIQQHVPAVLEHLQSRGVKTVGVLKFRVRKPGQKTSDRVGLLNSLLADRLEVGLILANPFAPSRQLNIIKDASEQAEKITGASHLNASGRAAFFGPKFQLAWGERQLPADAFLTGVVQVHEGLRTATVGILCFHRQGGPLEQACAVFEADLDVGALTEMGESYVLRGAFDGGQTSSQSTATDGPADRGNAVGAKVAAPQQPSEPAHERANERSNGPANGRANERAVAAAVRVNTSQAPFPLKDPDAQVQLEILYDGRNVPVQLQDGRAFVAEPRPGQRVEFAIVRTDKAHGRLGVVLRVNGENTLYRQTMRDLDCSKWILTDDHRRTVIKGYQMPGANTAEQFTVLAAADSAARAVNYGRSVGQIQITVFREEDFLNAADLPPTLPDEQEEDLAAISRATQPIKTPDNLSALKAQVRTAGSAGTLTRGLIVQGQASSHAIRPVKFVPDPTPVMSATITYYTSPQ